MICLLSRWNHCQFPPLWSLVCWLAPQGREQVLLSTERWAKPVGHSVSASTVTLQHHLPVQQRVLVPTLSRICILAVSRRKLCPGPHRCLHSGGWKAVPVRLQPHHQRQACEFGTSFICCLQVIHLGQQEHKCSLTHTRDLCYSKSNLGKLESSVLLRLFYFPVWGLCGNKISDVASCRAPFKCNG